MSATAAKETLGFQAEVKQLLHLMIHSLYSNKEIFLRELISNASDAADKLRFEALSDASVYGTDAEFRIRVSFDKAARTLTVSDNGVGMSRDEVIANIGTIAKSGTREFFQALTGDQAKDAHLIGQFGVGFYSSFIVADRVTLVTRRAGLAASDAVRWESDGGGDYSIEAVEKEDRGTEGPISTVQLANLRRGLQDHLYLTLARQAGLEPLVQEALQAVVPRVYSDAGETVGFAETGEAYDAARLKLGQAIEAHRAKERR